jgi:hypothetical protein
MAAAAAQPSECSLDNPPLRKRHEAAYAHWPQHSLQNPAEARSHPCGQPVAAIGRIGEDDFESVKAVTHLFEEQSNPVLVLDVGGVYDKRQNQTQCIDRHMSLAAADLLAGVVPANSANFGRSDALAVDNRGAGRRFAARRTADLLAECVVNLLPNAPQLPLPVQIVNRSPVREIVWQLTPLTSGAVHIQDGVDHLPAADGSRPSHAARRRQERFDQLPLLVG